MGDAVIFYMGEFVEARKDVSEPFLPGQVVAVHKTTGLYDVAFHPKGEAFDLSPENLRKVNDPRNNELPALSPRKEDSNRLPESTNDASFPFKVGEQVEARRDNQEIWRFAVIAAVNYEHQTVDVIYSDHYREKSVPLDRVRSFYLMSEPEPSTASAPTAKQTEQSQTSISFEVGTRVLANYRSRGKYYPAKVKAVREDQSYDLEYDDGESETRVETRNLRSAELTDISKLDGRENLREGQKVEADYRGAGRYYPGRIRRVREEGTFDIDYDDGESERQVEVSRIRIRETGQTRPQLKELVEGLKVEGNYREKGKWFPGRIRRDRGDDTFDIAYDDGEEETRVKRENIRPLKFEVPSRAFEVGTKVEANYRSRGKYYPGTIRHVHLDEVSYDIDYDDGESEKKVKAELIRLQGDRGNDETTALLKAGDLVEANYRGKGKYYPGKVTKVCPNGCYDVSYDDGESEASVSRGNIRLRVSPLQRYEVGARVEARYRGKPSYYSGKITVDHGDGCYDIDYDDGEKETRVKTELIRGLKSSQSGPSPVDLVVGDKIEANFRGRGRFFPAKIQRVNRVADGSTLYDVLYDDGEEEKGVVADWLRLVEVSFQEGSRVDGNYRGSGRWYPGKVRRAHGDGSYDIDYDDGEVEIRVHFRRLRPHKEEPRYNIGLVVEASAHPAHPGVSKSGKITFLSWSEKEGCFVYSIAFLEDGVKVDNIKESQLNLPRLNGRPPTKPGAKPPTATSGLSSNSSSGYQESPLKHRRVKETSVSSSSAVSASLNSSDSLASLRFVTIEANFRSSDRWLAARIIAEHPENQTVDVEYEDLQEREIGLPLSRLRLAMSSSPRENSPSDSVQSLLQTHSLVEVKDFRLPSQSKWLKARVIAVDHEQGISSVRLIHSNEVLEHIAVEEMRLLRTASAGSNQRTGSSQNAEDTELLRAQLQEKAVEVQQLKATILSLTSGSGKDASHSSSTAVVHSPETESMKAQQQELTSKYSLMEELVTAIVKEVQGLKKRDEDLHKDVQGLRSTQETILQRLKEKKTIPEK